jgi:class 3 adenylate cyclase/tetratricopeptide (TPR) repeat protein
MEAERRQVTVLFTDMVGFTTFSERSGEEAAFKLMRSLAKLMDEAVREQGGTVHGFTGDGIMAVFGAPVALEDAPLRGCRAALSILQRLKTAGTDFEAKYGVQPQLRIGLNTGAVVVGKVQSGTDAGITVLGDTVNLAERLRALAEPDAVFMSEATHQLVQGMVEASFAGEHQIKGKSEPQRVHRLDAIRQGTTRFEAAVSRGLSAFVGRERELAVLEQALVEACLQFRVIDLVAEPGMGKSRLLHEFRHRIDKERVFVASGSCSPDGQQTPFLPFIEVMRGSFQLSAGEAEKDVAQKLEAGLTTLGLHSARNLALLLHMLGLKVPDDALNGLDGVLIGLRTRELLQQLLEARCSLSPVIMVIEDLHWIDSVSEEVLGKLFDSEAELPLLLLTTRRPEYKPPWLDRLAVTKLRLEPLPAGDIHHLIQSRLRREVLPDALARQVTEKAEGNPLFAEEIVSFLRERGVLRATAGKLDFDAGAVAAALPASVESLLTARVDRLAPKDRALMQAASVIGRRFNPQLLAVAVGETDIDARLATMQALDLVHADARSRDYLFKHALVRDAIYQSLLTEPRTALHLKIAEEVERRSGNRLAEVAEVLAHHYRQTSCADKAFAYLSMAGGKSVSVYSLDEAATHFHAALALLDKNPDCASDDQVAEFLVSFTLLLHMTMQLRALIETLERYLMRVDRLGDDPRAVLIRHQYVFALLWSARYREAAIIQRETSPIAARLGDSRSQAYAIAGEISVSTMIAPKPLNEFDILKEAAIKATSATADVYIQNWTRFVIGWEEFHRGRMVDARDSAHELMQVSQVLNDPRSKGLGLALLTWISLISESFSEALEYSEQSLAVAVTPFDRIAAINGKGCALTLLRRTEEGVTTLEETRRRCINDGDLYTLAGSDGIIGLSKILQGKIREGIRFIEEAILRREKEGYRDAADWYRLFLGEVYLTIIAGDERLPIATFLKNLPILLRVMVTAASRIRSYAALALENPHYDPAGHHAGRVKMMLGLLYQIKKKRALAVQHLTEARRLLCQIGQTPLLTRVDAALAELA